MSRAAALVIAAIAFGFPLEARALAVSGFEPHDVTIGTRLTIRGDFAELLAAKARPMVQGRRIDSPKTVQFQVLAWSRRTIIARVKSVPSTRSDPAAGKIWSLVVRCDPLGLDAEADGPLTTSGPLLASLDEGEAAAGSLVTLYAIDPGSKAPTVLLGRNKAKVLLDLPAGANPDDDPWSVTIRVPRLRNGFYTVRLENSLGRAPERATLLLYGSDGAGLDPYANVAVQGRPALVAPVCTWSAAGDAIQVSACAGDPCARSLSLELVPDGRGSWAPARAVLTTADPWGGAPEVLESVTGEAKLLPSPASNLLAGAFVAALRPVAEPGATPLRIRGYFQAAPGE
ncbi:MAG TPA: hypothetical protein VMR86_08195 [Myxococcota bacterium]|nr:hypothetical protein [Myxococcota bacterium]